MPENIFFLPTIRILEDLQNGSKPGMVISAIPGNECDEINVFRYQKLVKTLAVDANGYVKEVSSSDNQFNTETPCNHLLLVESPRLPDNFCQQPSKRYEKLLDLAGGDPRVVSGEQALKDLENRGGWSPDIESRDARRTGPER